MVFLGATGDSTCCLSLDYDSRQVQGTSAVAVTIPPAYWNCKLHHHQILIDLMCSKQKQSIVMMGFPWAVLYLIQG